MRRPKPQPAVRRLCRTCQHANQDLLNPDEKGNPCSAGLKPQARRGRPYSRVDCPKYDPLPESEVPVVEDELESAEVVPFKGGQIIEMITKAPTPSWKLRFVVGRMEKREDGWWVESRHPGRKWYPAANFRALTRMMDMVSSDYDRATEVFDRTTGQWQTAQDLRANVNLLLLLEKLDLVERDFPDRPLVLHDGRPAPIQWRRPDLVDPDDELEY